MNRFFPSKKVLEGICRDPKKFTYFYSFFPRDLPDSNLTKILGSSAKSMITLIGEFYNLGLNPMKEFNVLRFFDVFLEGNKNSFAYEPIEKETIGYGLFLGDKGLCQGFKGNYFRSQETKDLWEKKFPISSTKTSYFSGKGLGKEGISNTSDAIEVDIKEGILYCVQTHKSLNIVPGKFYFTD